MVGASPERTVQEMHPFRTTWKTAVPVGATCFILIFVYTIILYVFD